MAEQFHTAALEGKATVKLSNAGALADTTLKALLLAAGVTQAILDRTRYAVIKIVTGTVYMADSGSTTAAGSVVAGATANSFPYEVGEIREIKNSRSLIQLIHVFTSAAYEMRVELY